MDLKLIIFMKNAMKKDKQFVLSYQKKIKEFLEDIQILLGQNKINM